MLSFLTSGKNNSLMDFTCPFNYCSIYVLPFASKLLEKWCINSMSSFFSVYPLKSSPVRTFSLTTLPKLLLASHWWLLVYLVVSTWPSSYSAWAAFDRADPFFLDHCLHLALMIPHPLLTLAAPSNSLLPICSCIHDVLMLVCPGPSLWILSLLCSLPQWSTVITWH